MKDAEKYPLLYTEDHGNSKPIKKVYSITEISSLLKGVIENHFTGIQIKAELSSVKRHSSGHIYFALKDESAVLDGVCWRGAASKLAVQPQDGLEVICTGRLTIYPGRSKYQIIVDQMELSGEGNLLKQLEDLKRKLLQDGLFDPAHKKNIPFLPQRIGVITSPTGAVIRDILHRLQDRFPRPVTLWPVPVQGAGASAKIKAAIDGFNTLDDSQKPDVLILARGGGSLEDLWCFQEESVVRAVYNSSIPIITAVGHETDTTLVDFASDFRAPTPTAAAEKAVPVRSDLVQITKDRYRRLNQSMRRIFEDRLQYIDDQTNRLNRAVDVYINQTSQRLERLQLRSPSDALDYQSEKITSLQKRLDQALKHYLETKSNFLTSKAQLLESYSFKKTLDRGFCVLTQTTTQSDKKIVTSRQMVSSQDQITATLKDGEVSLTVN